MNFGLKNAHSKTSIKDFVPGFKQFISENFAVFVLVFKTP